MQAAFLSFILLTVRLFVPLDCTMRLLEPEPHLQLQRMSAAKPHSSLGFSRLKKGIHSPFWSKSHNFLFHYRCQNFSRALGTFTESFETQNKPPVDI